jgi:hypothetical protein
MEPLWRLKGTMGWAVVSALGAFAIGFSWYRAAGQGRTSEQTVYLNIAVIALILCGLANLVLVLLPARRVVGNRRRSLLRLIPDGGAVRSAASAGGYRGSAAGRVLVAGPGLRDFHNHECPMASGRGWSPASREEHVRAGRIPCRVCEA